MINDFIEQFTYVGIFLVLFLGGLGVPIPEELPVLAAGALAHEGYMRAWVALLRVSFDRVAATGRAADSGDRSRSPRPGLRRAARASDPASPSGRHVDRGVS